MDKIIDTILNVSIVGGVALSITDLQSIVGIILLVVQLCLVISKVVIKIVHALKSEDKNKVIETIKESEEDIKELERKVEDYDQKHNSK